MGSNAPAPFVEIAFGCDAGYLQPLTVAVASVVAHARAASRLRFWILSDSLAAHNAGPLMQVVGDAGATIGFVPVHEARRQLSSIPLSEHLTEATYYRLLVPQLLPPDVDRAIYLDCDLLVRHPIEELWAEDLRGRPTAAVLNPAGRKLDLLGLRRADDYFNAGVLVLDLQAWREQRIAERALAFALEHPGELPCQDQDALNQVHAGNWHRLDLRWNQQSKFFDHSAADLQVSVASLRAARTRPFIVHFTSTAKPWHDRNAHPWRRDYYRYLDRTPFRGWRAEPPSLGQRLVQAMPPPLRPDAVRRRVGSPVRALRLLLRRARSAAPSG